MLAAAYGTVSDIEMLWIGLSAVGAGFAFANFWAARKNKLALEAMGIMNGRLVLAKLFRTASILRSLTQVIFLSIGAVAAALPEPPPQPPTDKYAFAGFAIRWGLITASGLLLVREAVEHRVRSQLIE